MLRTFLQSGLVLLLVAAILFGGCVECPKACCLKSRHCGKVQAQETASLPSAANHWDAPVAVVAAVPVSFAPAIRPASEPAPWRFFEELPPDLCLLNSLLRI